ncbi:MAG TPA: nucleotidyltransferase domain-containing protein [archaeon]|nr:nucleotidyltransferase domain-containing protein [archaeon]
MGIKAERIVIEFAGKVKKKFPDAKIFLFGSRAGRDFLEKSDYDIIIVSRTFEGKNFFERPLGVYDFWNQKTGLDVFCYTPKEFEQKSSEIGFVSEALKGAMSI